MERPTERGSPWQQLRAGVAELKAGARAAAALSVEAPPADHRLRRVAHGFALTWILLGIAWRDPNLRRAYLRWTLPISLLTLAAGVFLVTSPWTQSLFRDDTPPIHHHTKAFGRPIDINVDFGKAPKQGITVHGQPAVPAPPLPHAPPVTHVPPVTPNDDSDDDKDDDDDEADGGVAVHTLKSISDIAAAAQDVTHALEEESEVSDDEPKEPEHWSLPSLSALYAALATVERLLLALTRDHQHMLSRALCLETGALPEDPEKQPRLRLSFKWIRKKISRKVRGALILASIAPLAGLAEALPTIGRWASVVTAGAWSFYWLCTFALGSADVAWEAADEDPIFVRACLALGQVPVVGWVPRTYGRVWRRLTRGVRPVCASAERASHEALGLGLARLVNGFPIINSIVRPAVPVAAQLALRQRLAASGPAREKAAKPSTEAVGDDSKKDDQGQQQADAGTDDERRRRGGTG